MNDEIATTSSRNKRRRRDSSDSSDSSSDSSSSGSASESESESERKKRKKRKTKEKKKKEKETKKKKKDKKKKKEKKRKGEKKEKSTWGKHGIIAESDIWTKDAEFRAWLVEVKRVSPEDRDAKKHVAEYVEDFNMGILPHTKYYNMDAFDKHTMSQAAQMGNSQTDSLEFDFARDEQMLKQQQRAAKNLPAMSLSMSTDELRELKRVQEERVQIERMKKLGYKPKEGMGVRYDNKMLE
ncbi:hypothetical protein BDR26DRAFT_876130 [Obelidium mucronatum]|nr:hypothetical protein BDR26DRAFT_876130 [Obelidium mucronatum]